MKNAYELAETILKSRPDKNGELNHQIFLQALNYMVHQLAKKYRIWGSVNVFIWKTRAVQE